MLTLFKNLYNYRQMIFSLTHRELRGRYKGSVLGFLWTFLNLFLFVALIPWIFFSTSLAGGCGCIIASGDMVKKIYFPREVLPLSFVVTAFVNMLYCFVVVFAALFFAGVGFNFVALLYLPLVLASALTVYVRDLQHILGIVVMAWQFLTPVMYSSSKVPDQYKKLFMRNPMTPIIESIRSILYYKKVPHVSELLSATLFGVFFLVFGEFVFSKLQRGFAEEL